MNANRAFVRQTDRTVFWLASLIVLGAGYYTAFAFVNAAIDVQNRLTARVAGSMRANARTLAQRRLIAHEVALLATNLRELDDHADGPTAVARFISIVTRIGARRAVSIIQIDGRQATPAGAASLSLDVTLRGSYRALLAAIRDLGQAPLVMRIDVAALESAGGADGPLIARVQVVLERTAGLSETRPACPKGSFQ